MLAQQPASQGIRPSPIFFAIVAATAVAAWLSISQPSGATNGRIAVFAFIAGAWTVSLIFHEFAHAVTAWMGGDRSVAQRGYLTLDPRVYTNPLLSFILPMAFIIMGGLAFPGGAVLINRAALSRPMASLVGFVGPFTNLIFGCLSLGALATGIVGGDGPTTFSTAVAFFGFLQFAVFVLNMLPIPGFDGFAIIEAFLPSSTQQLLRPVATYGPILAILLIWRQPWLGQQFFAAVDWMTGLFGVTGLERFCGLEAFRFWQPWEGNVADICP